VGNLIWVLLEIYCCLQPWKNFANRSRIDKVIAMVRVAPFFDSRCIKRWDSAYPHQDMYYQCRTIRIRIRIRTCANRQTDRQTNNDGYIYSLAEVKIADNTDFWWRRVINGRRVIGVNQQPERFHCWHVQQLLHGRRLSSLARYYVLYSAWSFFARCCFPTTMHNRDTVKLHTVCWSVVRTLSWSPYVIG